LLNQPRTALQTELDQFYRVVNQASVETQVVTAQAFSKARNKLKPEVFESLNQALQQQIDSLGLRQTWRGLRVLAVDGSSVHLPLEPAMKPVGWIRPRSGLIRRSPRKKRQIATACASGFVRRGKRRKRLRRFHPTNSSCIRQSMGRQPCGLHSPRGA
jgi:hypothetical protein